MTQKNICLWSLWGRRNNLENKGCIYDITHPTTLLPHDGASRNLVVKSFPVKMNESWVHLDIIYAPGRERVDFTEDGDGVSSTSGGDIGLLHHVVPEGLGWIHIS